MSSLPGFDFQGRGRETYSAALLDYLLRPRSIALVGASATPGSIGESVLRNLQESRFAGDLYLINPKRTEVGGRACLPSIDHLPEAVDCAVLAIPRAGVIEALSVCARRGVRAAIIFAAGFAETGPQGREDQERLAQIAREHKMTIEGPNCLGMVNAIDSIPLTFVRTAPEEFKTRRRVAVLSQSGALAAALGVSLRKHGIGLSFSISTGNEAATSVEDFLEYLIDDEDTHAVAMVVELFRQPRRFLDLAARAREGGKQIILLHPGRSAAARTSAATHTGAIAGDYQVMRVKVAHAGVITVNTLEELIDVSQMAVYCPSVPQRGAAVLTESGAFKALTLDFCEEVGLALPELNVHTTEHLRAVLPDFIPPSNPLDVTAQALVDPGLYNKTLDVLLQDSSFGSFVLAIILTDEHTVELKLPHIVTALVNIRSAKPVVFAALDEGAALPNSYVEQLHALNVPVFPSPERAFRALARFTRSAHSECKNSEAAVDDTANIHLPSGIIPEHKAKQVLAAAGISVPCGALARTLDEAQQIGARIGYPVALKAQSGELCHKSDAGGVMLNVLDGNDLRLAWDRLHKNTMVAMPDLTLDGVLVERMSAKGTELILGAHNDPEWGPVLLVGLGGVYAEALNDVRLLPPDLSEDEIIKELGQLKSSALLNGFRGSPPADVRAVARIVRRTGALMSSVPAIREIDINPVVAYPDGQGAIALDALIVTGS